MAKTTVTLITDDMDGSNDAETIEFSYRGQSYMIDLSGKNQKKLDAALEPFISAATRVRGTRRRGAAPKTDLARVRAWAKEQGLDVSDRGRVPKSIVDQYEAAH